MPNRYIHTDVVTGGIGTSGDPYSTLSEAWEAEDTGISGGETWNFFLRGTAADTTSTLVDTFPSGGAVTYNFYPWHTDYGATSDADDGWVGDSTTVWSTSHYRLDPAPSTNGYCLRFNDTTSNANIIRVEGIQIGTTTSSNGVRCLSYYDQSASNKTYAIGNRFSHGTGGAPRMIRWNSNADLDTSYVKNNLFVYDGTSNCSSVNINANSPTFKIYNNTAIYTSTGGEDFYDDNAGDTSTLINNVTYGSGGATTIEYDKAGTVTTDYNASQTSGDRGTNGFAIATGDFTNYSGGDYTPAASQTNAWGTGGETNADDAEVPTTDIRGKARNTGSGEATAIGCFADSGEGASGPDASGTPSLTAATGDGALSVEKDASGTPSLSAATGDGALGVEKDASGTPSLAVVTGDGALSVERDVSGTPTLPAFTGDGALAFAVKDASGTPSLPVATGDGALSVEKDLTGTPSLAAATGDGALGVERDASGTPSLPAITGDGALGVEKDASGTPSLPAITGDGGLTVGAAKVVSGTPSLPAVTGDGALGVEKDASGTPTLAAVTGDGALGVEKDASGTPSLPAFTGDGALGVGIPEISGTPSLAAMTGSGAVSVPTAQVHGAWVDPREAFRQDDANEEAQKEADRRRTAVEKAFEVVSPTVKPGPPSRQVVRAVVSEARKQVPDKTSELRAETRKVWAALQAAKETQRALDAELRERERLADDEDAILALLMVA